MDEKKSMGELVFVYRIIGCQPIYIGQQPLSLFKMRLP